MSEEQDKPEPTYRVGKWAGLTNYECLICPFASLDEEAIGEHLRDFHERTPIQEPKAAEESRTITKKPKA